MLVSFVNEIELSEMMSIAQAMRSLIVLEVRFPVIVDSRSVEVWQDANVIHRFRASLLVKLIVR